MDLLMATAMEHSMGFLMDCCLDERTAEKLAHSMDFYLAHWLGLQSVPYLEMKLDHSKAMHLDHWLRWMDFGLDLPSLAQWLVILLGCSMDHLSEQWLELQLALWLAH